jgi:DNA (cytosine-5)-methyltransferase 1
MKLLDLYCGGGGAALGYAAAGFEITGVDIKFQTNYPFNQVTADVMDLRIKDLQRFDVIHASPPCQGYSHHTSVRTANAKTKLIAETREMLKQSGKPYIIENVVGAKDDMIQPILLCGTMFGLHIARHRLFETTLQLGPFDLPPHPMCKAIQLKYATEHGINPRHMSIAGKAMNSQHTQLWRTLMDWPEDKRTSQRDLKEAIPPAYSKWIGTEMLTHLGATGRDQ